MKDSNLRKITLTDLQSAPFGRSGNSPFISKQPTHRNQFVSTLSSILERKFTSIDLNFKFLFKFILNIHSIYVLMTNLTSTLPLIAFEYGQLWCALSTISFASSIERWGNDI